MDGTKRVVETLRERGERIDWCIVGEPSSESSDRRHHQDRSARLTVGTADGARRAGPHRLPAARRESGAQPLRRHWRSWRAASGIRAMSTSSPPASRCRISMPAPARRTSFPGELKARFNLRYSPVQTLDELKRTVEEMLTRHGVRYTLEWYRVGRALLHAARAALECGLRGGARRSPGAQPTLSTGGGTSDGRFIAPDGSAGGGAGRGQRQHSQGQ